ncbi:MAG: PadR family transcriptional regulator [Phormidesmis sp.]
MKFEDIYQFFEAPPPIYLNKELAVCYVLSVLTRYDSYGTDLIHAIERDYPSYRLSDTVLYNALKFLETQSAIVGYWQKVQGRGRPRRMYHLCPDWQMKARELADLWQRYMIGQQRSYSTMTLSTTTSQARMSSRLPVSTGTLPLS